MSDNIKTGLRISDMHKTKSIKGTDVLPVVHQQYNRSISVDDLKEALETPGVTSSYDINRDDVAGSSKLTNDLNARLIALKNDSDNFKSYTESELSDIRDIAENGGIEWDRLLNIPDLIGKQGPQGEQGIQGIQGIQGEIGPKGDPGEQGLPGKDGENGADGEDGKSEHFHIKYSENSTGYPMSSFPKEYIGTCVTTDRVPPTNHEAYTWTKFIGSDGKDGLPGSNGEDGSTLYWHIKYGIGYDENNYMQFTENDGEDLGPWLGQYVDNVKEDSMYADRYTWSKIVGEPDWYTNVFKASTDMPTTPTGTSIIPDGWVDAPDSNGTWWMSIGTVDGETKLVKKWTTPIKVTGVDGSDGEYTVWQFAKNNSTILAPTTGWSNDTPIIEKGEYMWMRSGIVIPPATEPTKWSGATRISGEDGKDGEDGAPGASGPVATFRGRYDNSTMYRGTQQFVDIVVWNNGTRDNYYMTRSTVGSFSGQTPNNELYWIMFDGEFENIATKFIFAEGANIAGWQFYIDENGNEVLRSQNGSTTLNGTTGEIDTMHLIARGRLQQPFSEVILLNISDNNQLLKLDESFNIRVFTAFTTEIEAGVVLPTSAKYDGVTCTIINDNGPFFVKNLWSLSVFPETGKIRTNGRIVKESSIANVSRAILPPGRIAKFMAVGVYENKILTGVEWFCLDRIDTTDGRLYEYENTVLE